MEPKLEIRRLSALMPASGRINTKIITKPEQAKVINVSFPPPWRGERPIYINFDLWSRLTKPQRDMLLLQSVCWVTGVRWFKPELHQGLVVAGLIGGLFESSQQDAVGVIAACGVSTLALVRIWRVNNSQESQVNADTAAIRIAQRRGYSEVEAAEYLLGAIEAVARIEGRSTLNFIELIRCQNLRSIAGLQVF
ncbi:MAG: DUF3318 domain-containing protein [Cyanobacteria bacterium J06639_18]